MTTVIANSRITHYEGEHTVLVMRLEAADGTVLTPGIISAVTIEAWKFPATDPDVLAYESGSLAADVCFFDTLQTDGYMALLGDGGGYNFRFTIPFDESNFEGGEKYVIEAVAQTVGYGKGKSKWLLDVIDTLSD